MFFTLFGYWAHVGGRGGGGGVVSQRMSTHLLMQLFTLGTSKIEVFDTYFFDIVTT